ncbi:fibronectin type III domain-containing protein [Aeromicrobium sp. NPDC092404]|uniref:fibronectin type III domain-containing protein n=1 Tax=Aeromicrobium sp. NPDC092404 TaxID=3154976 RepID=UPI00342F02F0
MTATLRRAVVLGTASIALLVSLVGFVPAGAATAPAAPTGLSARAGQSSAVLSWRPVATATSYRVCLMVHNTSTSCARTSGQLTTTSFTVLGLEPTPGTDYFFKVYAFNGEASSVSALASFDLKEPAAPAVVTGITQRLGYSTLVVEWEPAASARTYSVCLMSTTAETCLRSSPRSATRTATFAGLTPTAYGDYYYRVYAYNSLGASSRSAKRAVDLPVGSVEEITAKRQSASRSIAFSWTGARNAETYEIQVSTSSSMTTELKTYSATGTTGTATGLVVGRSYAYRVRGINGISRGPYSAVRLLRLPANPATINVMTYNLCGQDKCVSSANRMKTWRTRKDYAGAIVRGAKSGIVATQESHDEDTRFITELPGFGVAAYLHAKTLFYDKARYDVLRSGGITLSSAERKYAVWAELRDRTSRATFIVVDAHLQPGKGKSRDDLRYAQTKTLLSKVAAANPKDLPVVYAGDYNSNKSNAIQSRYPGGYDAVLKVFTAAGIPDALNRADYVVASTWNSANQAINPPLKHSDHVDHIYVDPEIRVDSWRVVLRLKGDNYALPFATDHNPVRTVLTIPGR